MTKLPTGLFAAALVVGLGFAPTLAYAEEDATEETGGGTDLGEDAAKDETMMEKLEDLMKETPTDESTNPVAKDEDTDEDLF